MLQMVNLSDSSFDIESLLRGSNGRLDQILQENGLDGIEFLPCDPWNQELFPAKYIKGCHLLFWPNWLDFWRDDKKALLSEFGSEENVINLYGGARSDWLEIWRGNLRQAAGCGARYVVFHVANARTSELYSRRFAYTSEQVVDAAIELVNEIVDELPEECWLLFENLWWPGLTLLEPELAGRLLERVHHEKTGFMLDTGHLMNTNLALRGEDEAVCYIVTVVDKLGSLSRRILGMHLHCSFSGAFVERTRRAHAKEAPHPLNWQESMDYVMRVDRHRPFRTPVVRHLVNILKPQYLVHEFIQDSWEDWNNKVRVQCMALNGK